MRVNLGIALDRQGNAIDAVATLREAIRLNPGYAAAYSALGDVLSRLGNVDEAVGEYREAIQLRPGSASARACYALGKSLSKQGKFEEAIAAYNDAIDRQIYTETVHYDLMEAEHSLKKASKAIADFQDAVRARPTEYAVQKNLLGVALLYREKLGEAMVAFRESIGLQSDFAEAHRNLARTLIRQGKLREAIVEFREAIRLDPAEASTRKDLRDALDDLGDVDETIAP